MVQLLVFNHTAKAKYCVPREHTLRTAYRMAKIQRQRLKIHGLRISIIEEDSYAGSPMVQEMIALGLQDVAQVCQEKNLAFPDTLVVVGDNTVTELKNNYNLLFAGSLILHSKLKLLGCAPCLKSCMVNQ